MATGNWNDTTPPAPAQRKNVKWQADNNSPRNISAYMDLADAASAGGLMLASDLGGTALAPHVVGLQNRPLDSAVPTDGQLITWDNANSKWKPAGPAISSVFGRVGAIQAVAGDYTDALLGFTDITTGNASTSKHGFLKKLPNDATKFLDGTGAFSAPPSGAVSSVFGRVGAVVAAANDYTEDQISFSDITTNDASTSKHGYLKKLPNDATKFLDGTGAFSTPAGGAVSSVFGRTGAVVAAASDYTEAQLSFSDITTGDSSTSKHGYLKKLPNDSSKFLDGTGAFSTPPGAGGGSAFNAITGGTNTSAAMVVGAGATLKPTSITAGIITANAIAASVQAPAADLLTANGDFATTFTIHAGTAVAGDIFEVWLQGAEHVTSGSAFTYAIKLGSVVVLPARGFSAITGDFEFINVGHIVVWDASATGKASGTWGVGQANNSISGSPTLTTLPWVVGHGPAGFAAGAWTAAIDFTVDQIIKTTVAGLGTLATATLKFMVVKRR